MWWTYSTRSGSTSSTSCTGGAQCAPTLFKVKALPGNKFFPPKIFPHQDISTTLTFLPPKLISGKKIYYLNCFPSKNSLQTKMYSDQNIFYNRKFILTKQISDQNLLDTRDNQTLTRLHRDTLCCFDLSCTVRYLGIRVSAGVQPLAFTQVPVAKC